MEPDSTPASARLGEAVGRDASRECVESEHDKCQNPLTCECRCHD